MKKTTKVLLLFCCVAILLLTACTKIPAGNVAVKVKLYGSEKGVQDQVVGPGRYAHGWNTEYHKYPTFVKMYPFTKSKDEGSPVDEAFYFQSAEGVKCDVDVGVQARVDPAKVAKLFQTYREDLETIIKTYLRADIRDAINKYSAEMQVDSLYGTGKVRMMQNVTRDIQAKLKDSGLVIESITYLSDVRFPEQIMQGIVDKMAASQRAMQRENELREAAALAKKQVMMAQAEADANRIRLSSLNENLIKWEAIQNQKKFIEKWNGSSVPQYMGGGSDFNLLFSAGTK
jgi:regulator of protease activity HflC (stomatin/prohibitin superfamily)